MKTAKKIFITLLTACVISHASYTHATIPVIKVTGDATDDSTPLEPLSDETIVTQLKLMMKEPRKENIEAFLTLFDKANECHKLNIFKHILCLSNLGNPYASHVLELIRPKIKKEAFPKIIYSEPNLEEEDSIISYNERLDAEYEEFVRHIWDRYYDGIPYPTPHKRAAAISLPDGVKYPIRADLLHDRQKERFIWIDAYQKRSSIALKGWKLHISAQPSSARRIAEIAVPIIEKFKVSYKICISLNALRSLNTTITKGETQMGKFIAIYPKTEDKAYTLAKALDEAFTKALAKGYLHTYDFCELLGDARLGNSGALYMRYGAFQESTMMKDIRTVPLYPQSSVPKISPFKDIPIKFFYEDLPYDNCDSWITNTREIQRALLINTKRAKFRLSCPPISSWTKDDMQFYMSEKKSEK